MRDIADEDKQEYAGCGTEEGVAVVTVWQDIIGVTKTITIFDILDVGVVAYLIYQGVILVRETRAVQLVKGILSILLLYLLANTMGLKSLSFIMKNILQIGAIAVLVVFQPELRRALEQMGRTKFTGLQLFTSVSESTEDNSKWRMAIEAISISSSSFSRHKIGALIVIERQTKLGEIIKTGTVIDSVCSGELIGNIFFPNSPLHDGALVVRGGRMYAAGCFLPLSDNYEISRELGTRHRAALGMSENSDAIVIVVSEETGMITIAREGKLKRGYTPETLGKELSSILLTDSSDDKGEKRQTFWRTKK